MKILKIRQSHFFFSAIVFLLSMWLVYGYEKPLHYWTPGVADGTLTKEVICADGFHTSDVRSLDERDKRTIARRYGLDWSERKKYEFDHLIPLCLGGSNASGNIWPQPLKEARKKDRVEVYLSKAVCSGAIELKDAQRKIVEDWPEIYEKLRRN